MFRGQDRKVRILFGLFDIVLTAAAFQMAYATRAGLGLTNTFYIEPPTAALLMGWSMVVWVALGYWWEIYDQIDAAHPRVILRDAFRQCLVGAVAVVLLEF